MANSLYNQLGNQAPMNPTLQRFLEFKKTFNGNPQQMVQNLLNSGKITQAQVNQYAQQANELYKQFKNLI
jgi:hypothetical protein